MPAPTAVALPPRTGPWIEIPVLGIALPLAKGDGSVASADEVFQVTEGNPLFVEEVLRVGALDKHQLVSDGKGLGASQ